MAMESLRDDGKGDQIFGCQERNQALWISISIEEGMRGQLVYAYLLDWICSESDSEWVSGV